MRPVTAADCVPEEASRPRVPSLRRNFAWTLLGNFIYGGCQWAMVVAIAKLGTPEMVGRFALAFAVTAPIFSLTAMNMRAVLATDQRKEHGFADYLSLQLVTLTVGVALSFCFAALFVDRGTWFVLGTITLAKFVEALSDVYLGYLQQGERMHLVSRSLSAKGALSVAALTFGLWAGGTIEWGAIGLLGAWTSVFLLYDVRKARAIARATSDFPLRPRWNVASQIRIAGTALPLGITVCLGSLLVNVPRYFVERTYGARELGFFAALAYFMIIGARIVSALGESATPRLARHFSAGEFAVFRSVLKRMLAVGGVVGGIGIVSAIVFGDRLLLIAYRPEYAARSGVLVTIMIAAALNYFAGFLQYAVTATRTFRSQPLVVALSLGALAIACRVLVPTRGSTGAGIAMGIGFGVQVLGYAVIVSSALRVASHHRAES